MHVPDHPAGAGEEQNPSNNIKMDDLFKEAIISTYSFTDPESMLFHDDSICDIQRLVSFYLNQKFNLFRHAKNWSETD